MPLPRVPLNFHFLDKDKNIREDVTVPVRDTGYRPTEEYHPTMKLVRCRLCGQVGVAEFQGGFNLREGDRLMQGKPIPGECRLCGKQSELVPLPTDERALRLYYDIQKALDEAVRRGERLGPASQIWPLARVKKWEEWMRKEGGGGNAESA